MVQEEAEHRLAIRIAYGRVPSAYGLIHPLPGGVFRRRYVTIMREDPIASAQRPAEGTRVGYMPEFENIMRTTRWSIRVTGRGLAEGTEVQETQHGFPNVGQT